MARYSAASASEIRALAEVWGDSPRAYRGVTTHGFPNLFRIGSIGTGTGHTSQIMQIESGMHYVVEALRAMERDGLASIEVSEAAQEAYARRLHEMVRDTVWATGGCQSWWTASATVGKSAELVMFCQNFWGRSAR